MSVFCECCVLSGRGLCDELITRPEESCRLSCVVVCDLETLSIKRPWPTGGAVAPNKLKKNKIEFGNNCERLQKYQTSLNTKQLRRRWRVSWDVTLRPLVITTPTFRRSSLPVSSGQLSVSFLFFGGGYPKGEGSAFAGNVDDWLPVDTASYPTRFNHCQQTFITSNYTY